MSQQNMEALGRGIAATNRGDVEAVLAELDPEIEWHGVIQALLGGDATVYRGHEGVREWFRDMDEAFTEFDTEYSEVREVGDRVVALGQLRTCGRESGVETLTPVGVVVEFRDGKARRVFTYLDPREALEAAGLSG